MIKEAIGQGETVEEAIAKACAELKIETCGENFEILQMPTKKILGIFGGSPAKVRVYKKETAAQTAANYLQNILQKMSGENITVKISEEEGGAMLTIEGTTEEIGYIIGRRGETLEALQYLSGLVANQTQDSYYRIKLNIGNYREKRRQTLTNLATKIASRAVRFKKSFPLEPMNPYERQIVHAAVQKVAGAISWSEGAETNRHVVIGSKNARFPKKQNNNRNKPVQKKQENETTAE